MKVPTPIRRLAILFGVRWLVRRLRRPKDHEPPALLARPGRPVVGPPTQGRVIFDFLWDWFSRHAGRRDFSTVLEIGVGMDGFAPFYAAEADRYVGLDVDDYEANYRHIENARVVTYDGVAFPLENETFDLVVSHSVFEHVMDAKAMVGETWRVLKPGGLAFITIEPLYYASWGSHGRYPDNSAALPPWEHLNPASPFYLTDCPPQMVKSGLKGCYLNKLTVSDLCHIFGQFAFSILRLERYYEAGPLPAFIAGNAPPEAVLRNNEFRVILRKDVMTA